MSKKIAKFKRNSVQILNDGEDVHRSFWFTSIQAISLNPHHSRHFRDELCKNAIRLDSSCRLIII